MIIRSAISGIGGGLHASICRRPIPALSRSIRSYPILRGPSNFVPPHLLADDKSAEASTTPFREPTGINPAEKTAGLNSPLHQYGQYLTTCLPKFIQQFSVYKDELTIYIVPSSVLPVLTFLRDHTQCQYKAVMDITAVDYPTRNFRFEVGSCVSIDPICKS